MLRWLRWIFMVVVPIVGVVVSILSREWRADILGSFPFVWAIGTVSLRAVVFWLLVLVPAGSITWQIHATQREKREEQEDRNAADVRHARAVSLTVSRHADAVDLWVTNRGTHVIREIEITAIPDDEEYSEHTHGPLPQLAFAGGRELAVTYPILGGWFFAKVEQVNPDRGLQILSAKLRGNDFTRLDIDIAWNDHEGRRRKSHGITDLMSDMGDIVLEPRMAPA